MKIIFYTQFVLLVGIFLSSCSHNEKGRYATSVGEDVEVTQLDQPSFEKRIQGLLKKESIGPYLEGNLEILKISSASRAEQVMGELQETQDQIKSYQVVYGEEKFQEEKGKISRSLVLLKAVRDSFYKDKDYVDKSRKVWADNNNPRAIIRDYENNYFKLPMKAILSSIPWSDDYWASMNGGLSYRWNQPIASEEEKVNRYNYSLPKLRKSSDEKFNEWVKSVDINTLSPAEKYDIYRGDKRFTLTRRERKRTGILKTIPGHRRYDPNKVIEHWEGICHAWAPSTLEFKSPKPIVLRGRTGIDVPFAASDIKALLSLNLHHNNNAYGSDALVGGRCPKAKKFVKEYVDVAKMLGARDEAAIKKAEEEAMEELRKHCQPINPGAFHVVLTNKVGIKKEGIIMDVTLGPEVWNQPVIGYSLTILKARPMGLKNQYGVHTKREVEVENVVYYIKELHPNVEGKFHPAQIHPVIYKYYLHVDQKNKIIGGQWINNGPDYVSVKTKTPFRGIFKKLKKIYRASTADGTSNEGAKEFLKNFWRNMEAKVMEVRSQQNNH